MDLSDAAKDARSELESEIWLEELMEAYGDSLTQLAKFFAQRFESPRDGFVVLVIDSHDDFLAGLLSGQCHQDFIPAFLLHFIAI